MDEYGYILGSKVSALNFNETLQIIDKWIQKKENKYICIANTHSLVTASENRNFFNALNQADLVTPDGMPLVWGLKNLGYKNQDRVDGPSLMETLCKENYKIYLYGSTQETLNSLENSLRNLNASIRIVGNYSPPFKKMDKTESLKITEMINESKADIVFVGLGCPKQELWMFENSKAINSVLIGVGAAFDFLAGKKKRPPYIIQKIGLEWLYRLISEPKRLWKRYLYNNPKYIYMYCKNYYKDRKKTKENI